MTVIACLQLPRERNSVKDGVGRVGGDAKGPDARISPSDAAVLDVCAQLTPVVEPDGERIWMDWTGCGPVPSLVEKLASGLARLAAADGPAAASIRHARHRLGVAPLRFAAGAVAAGSVFAGEAQAGAAGTGEPRKPAAVHPARRRNPAFVIDTPAVSGLWVTDDGLPELLTALRIRALPEIDAEVQDALQALGVHTLGELARFPRALLYSHVGPKALSLLDWARGRDDRRVRALYPPERLERRISLEIFGLPDGRAGGLSDGPADGPTGGLLGAGPTIDAARIKTVAFDVAAELAAELEASRRACAGLTVAVGGQRLERSFTPPITAPDHLGRVIWQMMQRLPPGASHPGRGDDDARIHAHDDCVITITPTRHAGRQTTLFAPDRLGSSRGQRKPSALEHPALAAVRARFGHLFRLKAYTDEAGRNMAETGRGKEALARYEAMCRFYA